MTVDVAWILLHGGGHESGGAISFEAVLGSLVAALVVTGALWYLGVFHSLSSTGGGVESEAVDPDADPDSGGGD